MTPTHGLTNTTWLWGQCTRLQTGQSKQEWRVAEVKLVLTSSYLCILLMARTFTIYQVY